MIIKIQPKSITTANQYLTPVRQYVTLLDKQLKVMEKASKKKKQVRDVVESMPALISLVNTVAYLRGQDGMF